MPRRDGFVIASTARNWNGADAATRAEGCTKQAQKRGVCCRHGAFSLATTQKDEVERPSQPTEENKATVATVIARGRGGEINTRSDKHTNIHRADARLQPPSLVTSLTTLNFSNDDEIGAWIYRSRQSLGKTWLRSQLREGEAAGGGNHFCRPLVSPSLFVWRIKSLVNPRRKVKACSEL